MIQFKPAVRVRDFTPQLAEVLEHATKFSLCTEIGVEVNSIDDGPDVHMPTSLHGWSLAVDLDTVGDRSVETLRLAEWLRRTLPAGYDIVFENDHVHVEWDARRPAIQAAAKK